MNYQIKLLTGEQRAEVYNRHMMKDFHPSELKPYEWIEDLVKKGFYLCYGIFSEDMLLGYAYFASMENLETPILMLDYFAITNEARGKGIGSWFLQELHTLFGSMYGILLAEVENPAYGEDEENYRLRKRRLHFYIRNGFHESQVWSRVLTDQYQIIYYPLATNVDSLAILEGMREVYLALFPREFYDKNIWVGYEDKELRNETKY